MSIFLQQFRVIRQIHLVRLVVYVIPVVSVVMVLKRPASKILLYTPNYAFCLFNFQIIEVDQWLLKQLKCGSFCGRLAQSVEQRTFNPLVRSSSLRPPTNPLNINRGLVYFPPYILSVSFERYALSRTDLWADFSASFSVH